MKRLTALAAFSVTLMDIFSPFPFLNMGRQALGQRPPSVRCCSGVGGFRLRLMLLLLLLVVADGRLDGVLGEHRTVDLDRRQAQLLDDGRVLDVQRLVEGLAL